MVHLNELHYPLTIISKFLDCCIVRVGATLSDVVFDPISVSQHETRRSLGHTLNKASNVDLKITKISECGFEQQHKVILNARNDKVNFLHIGDCKDG